MEIVVLNQDNASYLQNIAPEVFDHPIHPTSLSAFLSCPRHVMVLAIIEEEVVGMASAVEYFHPDKPPQLWINEIGVSPKTRNKGIGRKLITKLLAIAEERGCIFAWLGTDMDNYAAQRCFNAVPDGEKPTQIMMYEWDLEED